MRGTQKYRRKSAWKRRKCADVSICGLRMIQNTQEIKRTLCNWTKQDKMCKFSRKTSFSSYVQHKKTTTENKQTVKSTYLVSVGDGKLWLTNFLDVPLLVYFWGLYVLSRTIIQFSSTDGTSWLLMRCISSLRLNVSLLFIKCCLVLKLSVKERPKK